MTNLSLVRAVTDAKKCLASMKGPLRTLDRTLRQAPFEDEDGNKYLGGPLVDEIKDTLAEADRLLTALAGYETTVDALRDISGPTLAEAIRQAENEVSLAKKASTAAAKARTAAAKKAKEADPDKAPAESEKAEAAAKAAQAAKAALETAQRKLDTLKES